MPGDRIATSPPSLPVSKTPKRRPSPAPKQWNPGAALRGRADGGEAGRRDPDAPPVAPGAEAPKAPPPPRPEIERVLDDGAEPGGLDRERIVALIARGRAGPVTAAALA